MRSGFRGQQQRIPLRLRQEYVEKLLSRQEDRLILGKERSARNGIRNAVQAIGSGLAHQFQIGPLGFRNHEPNPGYLQRRKGKARSVQVLLVEVSRGARDSQNRVIRVGEQNRIESTHVIVACQRVIGGNASVLELTSQNTIEGRGSESRPMYGLDKLSREFAKIQPVEEQAERYQRSEERRVGKERRS